MRGGSEALSGLFSNGGHLGLLVFHFAFAIFGHLFVALQVVGLKVSRSGPVLAAR